MFPKQKYLNKLKISSKSTQTSQKQNYKILFKKYKLVKSPLHLSTRNNPYLIPNNQIGNINKSHLSPILQPDSLFAKSIEKPVPVQRVLVGLLDNKNCISLRKPSVIHFYPEFTNNKKFEDFCCNYNKNDSNSNDDSNNNNNCNINSNNNFDKSDKLEKEKKEEIESKNKTKSYLGYEIPEDLTPYYKVKKILKSTSRTDKTYNCIFFKDFLGIEQIDPYKTSDENHHNQSFKYNYLLNKRSKIKEKIFSQEIIDNYFNKTGNRSRNPNFNSITNKNIFLILGGKPNSWLPSLRKNFSDGGLLQNNQNKNEDRDNNENEEANADYYSDKNKKGLKSQTIIDKDKRKDQIDKSLIKKKDQSKKIISKINGFHNKLNERLNHLKKASKIFGPKPINFTHLPASDKEIKEYLMSLVSPKNEQKIKQDEEKKDSINNNNINNIELGLKSVINSVNNKRLKRNNYSYNEEIPSLRKFEKNFYKMYKKGSFSSQRNKLKDLKENDIPLEIIEINQKVRNMIDNTIKYNNKLKNEQKDDDD